MIRLPGLAGFKLIHEVVNLATTGVGHRCLTPWQTARQYEMLLMTSLDEKIPIVDGRLIIHKQKKLS